MFTHKADDVSDVTDDHRYGSRLQNTIEQYLTPWCDAGSTRRPASADRTARRQFQAGLRDDVGL